MLLDTAVKNQPAITADVNYIKSNIQATFDLSTQKKSANKLTEHIDKRTVTIDNARLLATPPTLTEDGFGLAVNEYAVTDYFNDEAISTELYPQLIMHLSNLTGAEHAMVFDHTIRSVEDSLNREEKRSPILTVHNDYIASSAENRLHIELKKHGLKRSDYGHYQFINTWIPLVEVVLDNPLAFVDARTVSSQQSHILQVAYPDRTGEIEGFSFNPQNRWYYYPKMTSKEQLNFKVFDSNKHNVVNRIPHTAFSLPSNKNEEQKRVSIELRTILLFNK